MEDLKRSIGERIVDAADRIGELTGQRRLEIRQNLDSPGPFVTIGTLTIASPREGTAGQRLGFLSHVLHQIPELRLPQPIAEGAFSNRFGVPLLITCHSAVASTSLCPGPQRLGNQILLSSEQRLTTPTLNWMLTSCGLPYTRRLAGSINVQEHLTTTDLVDELVRDIQRLFEDQPAARMLLEGNAPFVQIGTLYVTGSTSLTSRENIQFIVDVLKQIEVDAKELRITPEILTGIIENPSVPSFVIRAEPGPGDTYYNDPSHNSFGIVIGSNGQLFPHQISRILTGVSHTQPLETGVEIIYEPIPFEDRDPGGQITNLTAAINQRVGAAVDGADLVQILDREDHNFRIYIGLVAITRDTVLSFERYIPLYCDRRTELDLVALLRFMRTLDDLSSNSRAFTRSLRNLSQLHAGIINITPLGAGGATYHRQVPIVSIKANGRLNPPEGRFPEAPRWVGTDLYRTNVYNAIMFLNRYREGAPNSPT